MTFQADSAGNLLPVLRAGSAALNVALVSDQLAQLQAYMALLQEQQGRLNLTGIHEPAQIERLLLLESIAAVLAVPMLRTAKGSETTMRLMDVGSGGGIPGIPLAIAFPHLSVTLLEARRKKVEFLQHAVQALALANVTAVWGRAEDLAHHADYREHFDVVTARGVGSLTTVTELALPFCHVGGCLTTYKSLPCDVELREAAYAIHQLGGRHPRVTPFNLPELPEQHCLVTVQKAAPTPKQYPRRAGRPARRPLSKP